VLRRLRVAERPLDPDDRAALRVDPAQVARRPEPAHAPVPLRRQPRDDVPPEKPRRTRHADAHGLDSFGEKRIHPQMTPMDTDEGRRNESNRGDEGKRTLILSYPILFIFPSSFFICDHLRHLRMSSSYRPMSLRAPSMTVSHWKAGPGSVL